MELWIRSQNKNILQKTDALFIAHVDENIWSILDNQNMTKYGEYTTKERALEILDEIQRTIAKNQGLISLMHNFTDLKGNEDGIAQLFKDMIYEMPEE